MDLDSWFRREMASAEERLLRGEEREAVLQDLSKHFEEKYGEAGDTAGSNERQEMRQRSPALSAGVGRATRRVNEDDDADAIVIVGEICTPIASRHPRTRTAASPHSTRFGRLGAADRRCTPRQRT